LRNKTHERLKKIEHNRLPGSIGGIDVCAVVEKKLDQFSPSFMIPCRMNWKLPFMVTVIKICKAVSNESISLVTMGHTV
jgi:hypothetical protein